MAIMAKVVDRYRGQGGNVWSEVFYQNATDLSVALDKAADLVRVNKRLAFLDNQNVFQSTTVSDTAGDRISDNRFLGLKGLSGAGAEPSGPASRGLVAVYDLRSVGGSRRKYLIRGCPFDFFNTDPNNGDDIFNPDADKLVKAYITSLGAGGWGIRPLNKIVKGPLTDPTVASFARVDDATISITTSSVIAGLIGGDTVLIHRVNQKVMPGLRGYFQVLLVQLNVLTIKYAAPPYGAAVIPASGNVRKATFPTIDVFKPDGTQFTYINTRKTKNAFFPSRASRRATVRRLSL